MIDLDAANAAFANSTAGRIAAAAIDRWTIALRESAALGYVRALVVTAVPVEAGARLRWCATSLGWAMLAHLLIRTALPRYASPGLPWWWNIAAAAFAFAMAIAADSIAAGWPQAGIARLWRGLTN